MKLNKMSILNKRTKMKQNNIIIPVVLTLSSSLALAADVNSQNKAAVSSVQPTSITNVDRDLVAKSNSFEKEVTPLLREISKKRSQLELRKLDRDLEKIDEESLKAQVALDALMNASSGKSSEGSAVAAPAPAVPAAMPNIGMANPSDIKVLMIFGFDNNLFAKLASGAQGGYVVKKGDVMPDGRVVSKITSNFIEVKKDSNKSDDSVQRFFVSSYNDPTLPAPAMAQPAPPSSASGGAPVAPLFPALPSSL